jgi:hypothetical protein
MTGCGMGTTVAGNQGTLAMSGTVHGGQQGVAGSVIQLYTVGNTGNGSVATPMLTTPVTTDSSGFFSITSDYACGKSYTGATLTNSSSQVYIVATGGNPGLASGTNNQALVMMAALGTCSNLSASSYIFINEVTTVAAAWALAPFMTSATNVGASATNALGIQNAFLNAGLLANTSNGTAATLPATQTIETGKLYALADSLASCINSNGGSACTPLFAAATPAGGTTPTNTLGAALNIVKNPGQNVKAVFNAIGGFPPYATTLLKAPNDWTMSMSVTGGGLSAPAAIDVDAEGIVWATNSYFGGVSAFSAQGTPISANGYGTGNTVQIGDTTQSYGLTIDTLGDIWATNYNATYRQQGAVTEFMGTNSGSPGTVVLNNGNPGFYDNSLQYPYAVAADTNGNIFIANNASSSATVYTSTGSVYTNPDGVYSAGLGSSLNLNAFPQAIAVDQSHGFWLPDGGYNVVHLSADGALLAVSECCYDSLGIATDAQGDAWVANYLNDSVSEVGPDGTVIINQDNLGGLSYPDYLAVDAAQNVWVANYHGGSISELAGNGKTVLPGTSTQLAPGTAISPTTGTYGTGGYGLDANMSLPFAIVPDEAGSIWVSDNNVASNKLVMFFGLATPTATPTLPTPTAP